MRDYRRLIDTNTSGNRCDVTPLFADPEGFAVLLEDLEHLLEGVAFDVVAGIDALGFVVGAALAARRGAGFLAIRKGGKLPVATVSRAFVDYTGTGKRLEIRADAIQPGTRILVADEWIETGAQVAAAISLLEDLGGIVVGVAAVQADDNPLVQGLREKYPFYVPSHG